MSSSSGLSRRALFGAGLTRLARERFDAAAPPPAASASSAAAPAAPRWAPGDWAGLAERCGQAREPLLAALAPAPGERLLELTAGAARLHAAASERGAEATASDADPTALPYGDHVFDCVASAFGAVHTPDVRRAAREIERVLRPGGRLGLLTWASAGSIGTLLRAARRVRSVDPASARPERWGSYEGLQLALERFPGFTVSELALVVAFEDRDALWRELTAAPAPLAVPGADEQRTEIEQRLAPFVRDSDGAVELRVDVCLVIAQRGPV